jgi:plasmid stability protein
MPNLLVRDLPDDVHHELQRRAAARGQSLQQFLTAELTRLTSRPSLDDLFARVERRRGGRVGFDTAAEDLTAARHDR